MSLDERAAPAPQRPRRGAPDRRRSRRRAAAAIALVVLVVAVLVVVRVVGSGDPGDPGGTGRDPGPAPAAYVRAVTTIPARVFDQVGTDHQPEPFTVTRDQPSLTSAGLPRFVYEGGEYCPYCAMMRYALIAALSRFGTFSHLKETTSGGAIPGGGDDGLVPTFSFLGATYKSPYLVFTPYERWDRQEPPQVLQTPPGPILQLYTTYDASASGQSTEFSRAGTGIPFLDIANRYVSSGDPAAFSTLWLPGGPLYDGGPGRQAIADGIHDPTSALGEQVKGALFVAEANYLSAAICSVDGGKPATVCTSPGVTPAERALAEATPVG